MAVAKGNNAYSSGYLAAMQIVWDLMEARESSIIKGEITRPVAEGELGYEVAEMIARLKLADLPTIFWLSMKSEQPEGATKEAFEAHKFFCKTALNISSLVGHTCGVERAGKNYKLVMTSHRKKISKKMNDIVVKKAVFVLSNYGLLHHTVEMGNGLSDFGGLMLMDEEVADEVQWRRLHALRRGQLLTDDEVLLEADVDEMSGATAEADVDEEGKGEDALAAAADQREIKWGLLPEGLTVAPKPASLDDSLKGKLIYMRWASPHGWLLGTISEKFTSASPRLFAKFNYRIKWFDGWENHKLLLENYDSGPSAPYHSWVLLDKVAP